MTTAILRLPRIKTISLSRINWKAVCILGFLMCLLPLVFYIYQINTLTRGTYLINSYENQIEEISRENKKLELGFAENTFLEQILSKTQHLDFQKITSVKYIQIPDNSVAKK